MAGRAGAAPEVKWPKGKRTKGKAACTNTWPRRTSSRVIQTGVMTGCMRMGNCLCDDADDLIALNKKYGFADPRNDPEWLAKNHHLFQCFGYR